MGRSPRSPSRLLRGIKLESITVAIGLLLHVATILFHFHSNLLTKRLGGGLELCVKLLELAVDAAIELGNLRINGGGLIHGCKSLLASSARCFAAVVPAPQALVAQLL